MVWRAWSEARGETVALKLLRIIEPALVDRALREGRLQATILSEHTVALHEVFVHRGSPVLAMEFVPGPNLLQVLHERRLGLTDADDLAQGLFLGLAAAHDQGVIHRDIKPGNVILPPRSGPLKPMLADFGLARAVDGTGTLTGTGILLGTPGYMAPEQIADPRTAGVAADLFSLGVVLYRVVTGRLPYQSARRAEVLARTASGRHSPVAELRPDAPDRMVLAIESALRPNPGSRPASVDAFRAIWQGLAEPPPLVTPSVRSSPIEPTLPSPTRVPSWNVTRPPGALQGRESELAQVLARVDDWPLITLLGLGGIGKTRLAVEAALGHQAGGGSAWLIDLSGATDLVTLCTAVAAVLGGRVDEASPLEGVEKPLAAAERPLVVLDHAAGVGHCLSEAITRWTGAAPDARFLITTRRHLGLPAEVVVELGPITASAALDLFVQQAQLVKPAFALDDANREAVVSLVARLGHHPLAIEIAASRVRLLPPTRLLERLGARLDLVRRSAGPTRLDSTLQWSWDQLPEWGQAALAACSVFRGGFSLEAAEAVLGPLLNARDGAPWPMDALQVLVDHCLVRVSEPLAGVERFTLPATVHAFASERPMPHELSLLHGRFYGALGRADRMKPLTGRGGPTRTRLLALERANLFAGAHAGVATSEASTAAGCALAWAWIVRVDGPYDEGIRLLQQVLMLRGLAPQSTARLDRSLGHLRHLSGRLDEASASLKSASAGFCALGDSRSEGVARGNLADVLSELGQSGAAAEEYQRALLLLAGHHRAAEAVIGGNLANLLRRMGDVGGAERAYRNALAISKQLHDQRAVGITQANLASLLMDIGRLDEAEVAYADALAIAETLDDVRNQGLLLGNRGLLMRMQGDDEGAAREFERAIALAQQVGHRANECLACGNLGDLLLSQGDLSGAEMKLLAAVELGDRSLPLAAAAFRGSLGELRFLQGDHCGGLALLDMAEQALRGRDPTELAKVQARRRRLAAR